MLSFFGRLLAVKDCAREFEGFLLGSWETSDPSMVLFRLRTLTLSCFFNRLVMLKPELLRGKPGRAILGAWNNSSSRLVAWDLAARQGSDVTSRRPWSTCNLAEGDERRMTIISGSVGSKYGFN